MSALNFILFLVWTTTAFYLYYRWYKKNNTEWNPYLLITGFACKIILGCLYGFIFQQYYEGDDTWLYHRLSLIETSKLLDHPFEFLQSIFLKGGFERYEMSNFWKEFEYTIFIKILAILNLFSGGNYYLNIFLYGSITFPASILLINLFSNLKPERRNIFCAIFFYFVPFVFWTSGIRREGFIILFFALTLSEFSKWIYRSMSVHFLKTAIFLLMLGIFRYSLASMLLLSLVLWKMLASYQQKWKPWKITSIYLLILIVFFFSTTWMGNINLPGILVTQQQEFLRLQGGSFLLTEKLKDDLPSFLRQLPHALDHVFLRPYPLEHGSLLVQFSKIESWTIILLILVFFFTKPRFPVDPFAISLLVFIMLNMILIGYTVPFLGAIVRYKVIHEVLLLAWMASYFEKKGLQHRFGSRHQSH